MNLIVLLSLVCSVSYADFTKTIAKTKFSERYCPNSADFQVCKMNYMQAKEFCQTYYLSLPTVRDFADWSISHGAKGILSKEQQQLGQIPKDYYLVASIYDDGTSDSFYFSHEGFSKPADVPEDESYWTASTAAQNKDYAHVFYSAFGGGGGKPEEHIKTYKNSVICLEKKGQ